jgi:hypothetical protein
MMEKFEFLLGDWNLESKIPKSQFHEEATGKGRGTFKRALEGKYVYFDYSSMVNEKRGQAHGIFAWDDKTKIYRYWWFESSGNFLTATCDFVNENTLLLNWHDTLLVQTFTKVDSNKVILEMSNPDSSGEYEVILEVIFTRKK